MSAIMEWNAMGWQTPAWQINPHLNDGKCTNNENRLDSCPCLRRERPSKRRNDGRVCENRLDSFASLPHGQQGLFSVRNDGLERRKRRKENRLDFPDQVEDRLCLRRNDGY